MGSEWLRRFDPLGGRTRPAAEVVRLVCFPHAGGAASTFLALSRAMAPAFDVLAVQYPGRQDRRREEPVDDIGRLADLIADEVHRQVEGPYAFFGHSMGAVLAYEVARRFAERQVPGPVRLFLSGRGAPAPWPSRHDRISSDAELLASVRGLGGTTTAVLDDPETRAMIMPALRADYRAIGSYAWTAGEPLDVPFSVLIGDSDPVATVAEASAWADFTSAGTTTHVFSGGHFYLDGRVREVAGTISAALGGPVPVDALTSTAK